MRWLFAVAIFGLSILAIYLFEPYSASACWKGCCNDVAYGITQYPIFYSRVGISKKGEVGFRLKGFSKKLMQIGVCGMRKSENVELSVYHNGRSFNCEIDGADAWDAVSSIDEMAVKIYKCSVFSLGGNDSILLQYKCRGCMPGDSLNMETSINSLLERRIVSFPR